MNNLTYNKKTGVLVLATLLICVVFINKKWKPTMNRWSAASAIIEEQNNGMNLNAEKNKWLQLNTELNKKLLAENDGKERWEDALTLMATAQKEGGPSLFEIEAEHTMQEQGFTIHSLPLVVTGNTSQILEFSRSIEEDIPSVHLYAMQITTKKRNYRKSRKLTSRFILRSIQP